MIGLRVAGYELCVVERKYSFIITRIPQPVTRNNYAKHKNKLLIELVSDVVVS